MKKFRSIPLFLILVFSVMIDLPCVAYADSPAPPNYFYLYVSNADPTVRYADILIKIDPSSKNYTDLNQTNAHAFGFDASAPIVTYDQDGYRSLSFHITNVESDPDKLQADSGPGGTFQLSNYYQPINTVTDIIKIALLDKAGNVVKVSDAASVRPNSSDTYANEVRYNARSQTPDVNFVPLFPGSPVNTYLSPLYILAFLINMVSSTALETVIAVPFKIRPLWKIIIVNIVTQILLFLFIAFGKMNYAPAVAVGEICVFLTEFVAYLFLFRSISKPRLALYTFVANAASLLVGLVLNSFYSFLK